MSAHALARGSLGRRTVLATVVVTAALAVACDEPEGKPRGVPERRLKRLDRGGALASAALAVPALRLVTPPVAAPSAPAPARVPPERIVECSSPSRRLHATLRDGDIWIQRDGNAPEPLVERARAKVIADPLGAPFNEAGIYACIFAPDARSIYFIADKYGTSRGVFAVSLKSKVVTMLDAGNAFFVIQECREPDLIGSIGVYRHDYRSPVTGFAHDWWVLIRPDGRQIGPIGQDENLDRFMFRRCGQGEAPADPPPRVLPPLGKLRAACPAQTITFTAVALLDGTTPDVFRPGDWWSAPAHSGSEFMDFVRGWDCAKGL